MQIVTVPCLRDNFAYLVCDELAAVAAVVDPGEAAPVLAAARAHGVTVSQVWATHHHPDHVGGVAALAEALPGLQVWAHRQDAAKVATALGARVAGEALGALDDGAEVAVGAVRARLLHNPGHTLGAATFVVEELGRAVAAFTGDTLFGAGCGRLFEGDAAMMHASLSRLAALPGDCEVYFGHEYTLANLRFADAVTPGDPEVAARRAATEERLAAGGRSTPSTVGLERATNPFLRRAQAALAEVARRRGADVESPAHVFAALRAWKDRF